MEKIKLNLRIIRRGLGLSQQQLAIRARLSQNTISEIERGEIRPKPETLRRLLTALGLKREDI